MESAFTAFNDLLQLDPETRARRDPARLLVAFKQPFSTETVGAALLRADLVLEDFVDDMGRRLAKPMQRVNHTDRIFWVRLKDSRRPLSINTTRALEETLQRGVDWVGGVYELPGADGRKALLCPLPHVLLVKPQPNVDKARLASTLAQVGLGDLRECDEQSEKFAGGYLYYVLQNPRDAAVYDRVEALRTEHDVIQEVLFENVYLLSPAAYYPNDEYYPQQWNMQRIRAGASTRAHPMWTGWDLLPPPQDVRPIYGRPVVAVIDVGCDLGHPDLSGQFVDGVRVDRDMRSSTAGDLVFPTGTTSSEAHGTACAGIIVGKVNNQVTVDDSTIYLGVAGLAGFGRCKVMPIAFARKDVFNIRKSIIAAADYGAQVISLSYGFEQILPSEQSQLDYAIDYACNPGPGGRPGLVICAATQNNGQSSVAYPARHPSVIACGASDQDNWRHTRNSPDGEPWESNYGENMSVVAPGVRIPTTDNRNGYGSDTGDYSFSFNGTSAATPHVAALAALILCLCPTMGNLTVRAVIEKTAQKIPGYTFQPTVGYPNGDWNNEMGYGLIDVKAALEMATILRTPVVNPG